MKVLCINSNGLNNDGITNSIINYYSHMDISDILIDMLKTKEADKNAEKKINDIGLRIVKTDFRKKVITYIFKTARMIKREKYDVVHVHGSSAILSIDLLAAWLGGCKVRIAHSRNTTCDHKIADKLLRPLFYLLCTDRLACGEDAGKWLFGKRKFTVMRNGKDIDQFKFSKEKRDTLRQQYELEGKIAFGHVGNFNYQKNHEFLIKLFAECKKNYPNSKLFLIGGGKEYLESAKLLTSELGLKNDIVFMGSINNVSEVLNAMDIMLFPSRFEGLPNVVLEWQIAGLPSLISDKITDECRVTDDVVFLPIDQGFEPWINAINQTTVLDDRTSISEINSNKMKKAGFDITENAACLKRLYADLTDSRKFNK